MYVLNLLCLPRHLAYFFPRGNNEAQNGEEKSGIKNTGFLEFLSWHSGNVIRLGTMRLRVRSLASLSRLRIRHCISCGVGSRHDSDLVLLLLWCRTVAVAPIRPLAWPPPYAKGVALNRPKKKNILSFQFGRVNIYQSVDHQWIDRSKAKLSKRGWRDELWIHPWVERT